VGGHDCCAACRCVTDDAQSQSRPLKAIDASRPGTEEAGAARTTPGEDTVGTGRQTSLEWGPAKLALDVDPVAQIEVCTKMLVCT